jgi:hypothetical protein
MTTPRPYRIPDAEHKNMAGAGKQQALKGMDSFPVANQILSKENQYEYALRYPRPRLSTSSVKDAK